jgi:prepilin-type N-terminal cleavage/methylation domain-containing protein
VWKVKVEKSGIGNRFPLERERGFTFLEIILVLTIMTLAMALTYPAFLRSRNAFHLRAVGRDVMNAIRVARESAVTEQKTMLLTIDNQNRKFVVSDDIGEDAREYHPPDDVAIVALDPATGEELKDPLAIRFLSNGSSESAQVLVRSETGAWLKIELDPITGSGQMILNQGNHQP